MQALHYSAAILAFCLLNSREASSAGSPTVRPIPLRDYCNYGLTNSLIGAGPLNGANNLASLPVGTNSFGQVPFDVSGIIQLSGQQAIIARRSFPEKALGIKVGAACAHIHILHGAGWSEVPHTIIATLALNYSDGTRREIPIVYGKHVYDWWENEDVPEDTQTIIAWTGMNRISRMFGTTLRIYKTTFANPHPGVPISTVDFISAKKESAPFLLGLTIE